MNTKTIGDTCELKVASRLVELGYKVSFPFGENSSYDLILDKDGILYRVQCKNGKYANGSITIRLQSTYYDKSVGKSTARTFVKSKVDLVGVYCSHTNEVYLIPVADMKATTCVLRVDSTSRNRPRQTRWAKDYKI